MFRTIIQITGIGLTLVSAIILSRGNLTLTPDLIVELQTSYAGYHPAMIKSLCVQHADNKIGIFLLCMSTTFQLVGLWPMRCRDFEVNRTRVVVVFITFVVVVGVSWTVSNRVAKCIQKNMQEKVEHLFRPSVAPQDSSKLENSNHSSGSK